MEKPATQPVLGASGVVFNTGGQHRDADIAVP